MKNISLLVSTCLILLGGFAKADIPENPFFPHQTNGTLAVSPDATDMITCQYQRSSRIDDEVYLHIIFSHVGADGRYSGWAQLNISDSKTLYTQKHVWLQLSLMNISENFRDVGSFHVTTSDRKQMAAVLKNDEAYEDTLVTSNIPHFVVAKPSMINCLYIDGTSHRPGLTGSN